jgi:hypothetical protein
VRALRTLAGLVLVLIGFPSLLAGSAGLLLLQHRDPDGAFTSQLAPVHADGYAVVVSDVDGVLAGSGVGLFGSVHVRVALRATNAPVVLVLAPADELNRYLTGVAVSNLTTVGFVHGDAPVTLVAMPGTHPPGPPPAWTRSGPSTVDWEPGDGPLALAVIRTDGKPGLDLTLAVSNYPTWLKAATLGFLLAGLAGLVGGITLLFIAAEPVLVVEAHRMVEFADRIAERLEQTSPGESLAVVRRTRGLDLTGELVLVKPAAEPGDQEPGDPDADTDVGGRNTRRWSGRREANSGVGRHSNTSRRRSRDGVYIPDSRPTDAEPEPAATGHTPPELADRWTGGDDDPDGTGESPYVHTAT